MTIVPDPKFAQLCEDVAVIRSKVERIAHLEERVDSLEGTRDKTLGFLAAVGLSGTALGAALTKLFGLA